MQTMPANTNTGTNGLLTSDFGSSTQRERHNSYYADLAPSVWHISWCLRSVGRDKKTPNYIFNSVAEDSILCLHGPMSTLNCHFFKILKFMISSTLYPHFLSGVYYDNGDCHILCA